jgi:biopolymer transport protein ExbD
LQLQLHQQQKLSKIAVRPDAKLPAQQLLELMSLLRDSGFDSVVLQTVQ